MPLHACMREAQEAQEAHACTQGQRQDKSGFFEFSEFRHEKQKCLLCMLSFRKASCFNEKMLCFFNRTNTEKQDFFYMKLLNF